MCEFCIREVLDGFNKNGTGVNFDHHHEVVVTRLGVVRKFPSLIGEDGVPDIIYVGEDITCFVALELI